MRLQLVAATAAVLLATSSATLVVESQDVVNILSQIPGVADFLGVVQSLGLPGLLDVLPATLMSPDMTWDKIRAGFAATGVGIIEITTFIGFILNYLDTLEEVNLVQRKDYLVAKKAEYLAAVAEAAEAAKATEEDAEEEADGEERFIIVPYHDPSVNPVIGILPDNRRVSNQHAVRYAPRRGVQYPAYAKARPPRPQSSRITNSRLRPHSLGRFQKRSATPSTPDAGSEGLLGRVVETGKHILWLLKKLILKEVQKEVVAKEMKEVVDKLTEDLMQQMDADGCLQKLMCHIQEKPVDTLTAEEKMLLLFFPLRQSHEACTAAHFPRCFISAPELDSLLTKAPTTITNMIP